MAVFRNLVTGSSLYLVLVIIAVLSSGCTRIKINSSIRAYEKVAEQVNLGDSKEKVLALLKPTQSGLPSKAAKKPEKYIKNGKKTEIYFFRSRTQADGLTTDDEFTPYVFEDKILTGIGWTVIGGPKTQGQAKDDVNIQQNTTVNVP